MIKNKGINSLSQGSSPLNRAENDFTKPLLRGHFHQAFFFLALGACLMLISNGTSARAVFSAIVYSVSLINLMGTSALYHRVHWKEFQRMWMRRLDHSAIFILIAGTVTPVCMLALSPHSGNQLLILIWSAAAFGVIQSLLWVRAPKWVSAVFYVAMGWMAAPYFSEIRTSLGMNSLILIILGGIIYTLGAVTYATKRPNPFPKVFGYHEIFHTLVIVAAVCHFLVIYRLIH
jgi:hemolysin III